MSESLSPRPAKPEVPGGEELELTDAAVPIPDAPHLVTLKSSRGGPYYLAPDSAEPLPTGMWAELDPEAVMEEADRINKRFDSEDALPLDVPSNVRKWLEDGGPASMKLLETLDRGLEAASTELLDALDADIA
jgi:hypothetical protein